MIRKPKRDVDIKLFFELEKTCRKIKKIAKEKNIDLNKIPITRK